jgi:hypothetical protein
LLPSKHAVIRRNRPLPLSVTPATAITDPHLLGLSFAGDSWATWVSILKAAYAEPMSPHELELFHTVAGDRDPPQRRVKELWVIAGRRSGKDSIASAIAATAALTDYRQFLRPGERASILCLACDRNQARIVNRYCRGYFSSVPLLQRLAVRDTDNGLELSHDCEIVIATNSFRSVRGRTIAAVVFDEVAFWRDETTANPDTETYNAVMPGLTTLPGSILIGITTAYRKSGLAYEKWVSHFGQSDDDILVVYGPATLFNPSLPQSVIDAAIKRDPDAARADWLSEWRSDLSDFIDRELVEHAIDRNVVVRPPQPSRRYVAFADPSGGRGDSFALGIAHAEGDAIVLNCLFERRSPFDPNIVVGELAALLRTYRLTEVTGDRYAANWVISAFKSNGIRYHQSERDRSAVYLDALPLFTPGRARLLDNDRLIHQFIGLERRTSRIGRDRVDHGPHGHDDVANSAAGALVLAAAVKAKPIILSDAALAKFRRMPQRDRFAGTMPGMSSGPDTPRRDRFARAR